MDQKLQEKFTKYEIARIIGARALQIAMDAPVLLKISEEELKEINYDALKISEKELEAGALPIAVHRPVPRKGKEHIGAIKEDTTPDEEIVEKEQQVEKEIKEDAAQMGFANADDVEDSGEETTSAPEEEQ